MEKKLAEDECPSQPTLIDCLRNERPQRDEVTLRGEFLPPSIL